MHGTVNTKLRMVAQQKSLAWHYCDTNCIVHIITQIGLDGLCGVS